MQISKSFFLVCAAAYCAVLMPLRAADTDTQARLRQALDQKLNELQSQTPAATPKAKRLTPPAQWAPPPASQPLPPIAQPAPAAQATPKPVLVAPPPVDSEAIAKAREALRQKMQELETQPSSATAVQPAPPAPATAVQPQPAVQPAPPPAQPIQPQPVVAQPAPAPMPAVEPAPAVVLNAPQPASPEALANARTALEQKMKELDAQAAMRVRTGPPAPGNKPKSGKPALSFTPLQPPPPAVSLNKQQQLNELLRKYMADEITPEQYHEQRAKILGEQ